MTASTREKLLEAAKGEFFEKGWLATGLAIRLRAGVSQGSWPHFFPSGKEQVAREIYSALHAELWRDIRNALDGRIGTPAHPSLLKALTSFLASVNQQPDDWRLLLQLEHGLSQNGLRASLTAEQRQVRLAVEAWAHRCRPALPGAPAYPIAFGPALLVAQDWLAGEGRMEPLSLAKTLTKNAINILQDATPTRSKGLRKNTEVAASQWSGLFAPTAR